MSDEREENRDARPLRADRRPPLGSWRRAYSAVVIFFMVEVVFFAWLTWTVS